MGLEVLGLDHIYVSVHDFERSEAFYDAVMQRLGFRKGDRPIAGERHAHYFNRFLQYTIRPARAGAAAADPQAPGLHHLCLQLADRSAVEAAERALRELGVEVTAARLYPEYAPDYYAIFFQDPDGFRLELVARMAGRDEIVEKWDEFRDFLNPIARLREREAQ